MQLIVKTPEEYKKIDDLLIGDIVLCDNGEYMPIKSIVYISCYPVICMTSNNRKLRLSSRTQFKTTTGFKSPELWDVLPISEDFMPMITYSKIHTKIGIFRDILIDGNMITVDGIVFRYGDEESNNGEKTRQGAGE